LRKEMTDERGAQQKPGYYLADHTRLAQPAKHRVQEARRTDHHDQLQQDHEQQVFGLIDRSLHFS
jgi:hypothetical protein